MKRLFLGDFAFYKNLFRIAAPIALQNLIMSSLNFVDTVMIGQLGETNIAAVALANQIFNRAVYVRRLQRYFGVRCTVLGKERCDKHPQGTRSKLVVFCCHYILCHINYFDISGVRPVPFYKRHGGYPDRQFIFENSLLLLYPDFHYLLLCIDVKEHRADKTAYDSQCCRPFN